MNIQKLAKWYIVVYWTSFALGALVAAFCFAWQLGVMIVLWVLLIAACMASGDDK